MELPLLLSAVMLVAGLVSLLRAQVVLSLLETEETPSTTLLYPSLQPSLQER